MCVCVCVLVCIPFTNYIYEAKKILQYRSFPQLRCSLLFCKTSNIYKFCTKIGNHIHVDVTIKQITWNCSKLHEHKIVLVFHCWAGNSLSWLSLGTCTRVFVMHSCCAWWLARMPSHTFLQTALVNEYIFNQLLLIIGITQWATQNEPRSAELTFT